MSTLNFKMYGAESSEQASDAKETVIILHGLLGMLDNWHSFANKLSENYVVYTIDQRNHGKSFHTAEFDYQLLSDDLLNFIEEHNIVKPHIMGHSMGGKTVMQFLCDNEEIVSKSIVVDISPRSFGGGHEVIFNALLNLDIENLQSRKAAQENLMSELNELGTVFFLLKNLGRKKEGGFEWKANIQSLFDNYENIKAEISNHGQINKEVMFIKGGRSKYIQEEDVKDIKNIFPKASVVTIDDAGHWVHADQAEKLLEEVLNFLKA